MRASKAKLSVEGGFKSLPYLIAPVNVYRVDTLAFYGRSHYLRVTTRNSRARSRSVAPKIGKEAAATRSLSKNGRKITQRLRGSFH